MIMNDVRSSLEDNYLTLMTIAAGAVVFIAAMVWVVTLFVKKVRKA